MKAAMFWKIFSCFFSLDIFFPHSMFLHDFGILSDFDASKRNLKINVSFPRPESVSFHWKRNTTTLPRSEGEMPSCTVIRLSHFPPCLCFESKWSQLHTKNGRSASLYGAISSSPESIKDISVANFQIQKISIHIQKPGWDNIYDRWI